MGLTSEDLKLIVSVVALVFTALNFLYSRFQVQNALTSRIVELEAFKKESDDRRHERDLDLQHIRNDIRELRDELPKIDLFWTFVQQNFPKMLLHHGEPVRDELIIKLSNNTIKHAEGIDLKAMLENEFEHLEDKKSTEAMYNLWTRLALEMVLKEERE